MTEKSATKALYEAAQARTVANHRALLPQTLTFSAQVCFSRHTLPQER